MHADHAGAEPPFGFILHRRVCAPPKKHTFSLSSSWMFIKGEHFLLSPYMFGFNDLHHNTRVAGAELPLFTSVHGKN